MAYTQTTFNAPRVIACVIVALTTVTCAGTSTTTTNTTELTKTVVDTTTTRRLGPAWIDQQRWLNPTIDIEDDDGFKIYRDYVLMNPNDLSTPMGALCWAHHEVERAIARDITRDALDNDTIPIYVKVLGLTTEHVGTGTQATEALRALFKDKDGSDVGPVDNIDGNSDTTNISGAFDISVDDLNISDESFEAIKDAWDITVAPLDEIGGDGTEWLGMFQEVAKPEVVAATREGAGLPASVQKYADALFAAVDDYLDGTRTDLTDPRGLSYTLPNWEQFVEEAKYSQDCQRAWLVVEGNGQVSSVVGVESDTTTTTIDVTDFTTTTESAIVVGPAWIDQLIWLNPPVEAATFYDHILNNPNDLSTPMAAACWVYHEVERALARYYVRDAVDNHIVPMMIGSLGLTVEQVGTGDQAIRVLRELLGDQNNDSNTGSIDISKDDLVITDAIFTFFKSRWTNFVEPFDEIGGDGTEWMDIFREVMKPDILAATRAGSGLPEHVQYFVDALFTAVAEFLDGTRTDLLNSEVFSYKLPNWDLFVTEAKYSQDCKRALLFTDSYGSHLDWLARIEINTTTTTSTTSVVSSRPYSEAWLDFSFLDGYDASLEYDRFREEYWLNNPNSLSTPMGAFCWAYHEINRALWRLLSYDILSTNMEWLMNKLDITVEQVGEMGPDRNTAILDILVERRDQDPLIVDIAEGRKGQMGFVTPGLHLDDDEMALMLFYSNYYIEQHRTENRIGGDGTEWYDAIRAVADPAIVEATRAGNGLPSAVVPYAERFFASVNNLAVDSRSATDDSYASDFFDTFSLEETPSDLVDFFEEAKYSPDCKRAPLFLE